MREIPLGWRTDLQVLRLSGSEVTESADFVLVETPDNPGYYWGNFLYISDPDLAGRPQDCLAMARRMLPQAKHLALGLPEAPVPELWEGYGVDLECDEVLASSEPPTGRALPAGYEARLLLNDRDWEQSLRNEVSDSGTEDPAAYADFAKRRIASRRAMVARGDAAFVGVFNDDELVAELGIVLCGRTARYQSVETVPAHRRRGLASHLLEVAGRWAQDHGADQWVIVADKGSEAGRLYRACGMRPVGESWQAFRGAE